MNCLLPSRAKTGTKELLTTVHGIMFGVGMIKQFGSLDLSREELSGTIPDSIGDLSSLGKWYVQFRNRESFV